MSFLKLNTGFFFCLSAAFFTPWSSTWLLRRSSIVELSTPPPNMVCSMKSSITGSSHPFLLGWLFTSKPMTRRMKSSSNYVFTIWPIETLRNIDSWSKDSILTSSIYSRFCLQFWTKAELVALLTWAPDLRNALTMPNSILSNMHWSSSWLTAKATSCFIMLE